MTKPPIKAVSFTTPTSDHVIDGSQNVLVGFFADKARTVSVDTLVYLLRYGFGVRWFAYRAPLDTLPEEEWQAVEHVADDVEITVFAEHIVYMLVTYDV